MEPTESAPLDKRLARASFDAAAHSYDGAAVLQREVADRLLERMDYVLLRPQRILDVGAGTGYALQPLLSRYRGSQVLALDVSLNMLALARRRQSWWQRLRRQVSYVGGDAEQLPLADASVDLIFSSLAIQWCVDLPRLFNEFRRVLKPGGLLQFSTFGPDTLKELRESFSRVDNYSHVNRFVDLHDIGDALLHSGFADPVMDMEMLTLTYRDAWDIMRDLKQIGAHNVTRERARGLTGRRRMQQVVAHYEQYRRDGVLPVTHEVVYGHAWCPQSTVQRSASSPREVHVPFPVRTSGTKS